MKKSLFSIKTRVTLWYALMTVVLAVLMLWALTFAVSRAANTYHEDLLLIAMADACDEIVYHGSHPHLDAGGISERVSFSLFSVDGSLWAGKWPPFSLTFLDGAVRQAQSDGRIWLVQDLKLSFPQGDLWLRGYLTLDSMYFMRSQALYWVYLLCPLLIALSALVGYLLTRRAFGRITQMSKEADQIAEGRDLYRRFEASAGSRRDEFAALAQTFNRMFERLEDSFARERQFTDDASHELRTPLTVIQSACGYALSEDDPQEWREALEMIQAKSESMSQMLSQLLHLARMDAGRIPFKPESVDISQLCLHVVREMQRDIIDPSGVEDNLCILGDELMLMRVIINLLDNALRYAKTYVKVSLRAQDHRVALTVSDDGEGMDEAEVKQIFNRFYQADASRREGGAGLGLSMVQSIVSLHGGLIHVKTAPGDGFEITIEFSQKK